MVFFKNIEYTGYIKAGTNDKGKEGCFVDSC